MQAWIYGKVRFLILTSKMSYQQVKQVKNRLIHMVIHIIHRILPTKRLFCGTYSHRIRGTVLVIPHKESQEPSP